MYWFCLLNWSIISLGRGRKRERNLPLLSVYFLSHLFLQATFPEAAIVWMRNRGLREVKGHTEGDLTCVPLLGEICSQSQPTRACACRYHLSGPPLLLIGLPRHHPPFPQGREAHLPWLPWEPYGFSQSRGFQFWWNPIYQVFFSFMDCAFLIYLKKSLFNTRS